MTTLGLWVASENDKENRQTHRQDSCFISIDNMGNLATLERTAIMVAKQNKEQNKRE